MIKIYYDGDCIFCSNFAKLVRLREIAGPVELKSLRENDPDVSRILESGLNVNTGFVVEHDGRIYHGDRAFHHLNALMVPENALSRVLSWIGGSRRVAAIVYPVMVVGRFVVLALQGRAMISTVPARPVTMARDSAVSRMIRLATLIFLVMLLVRLAISGDFPMSGIRLLTLAGAAIASGLLWWRLLVDVSLAPSLEARLRSGQGRYLLGYVGIWLLAVNAFDLVVMRRPVGLIAALPLLVMLFEMSRRWRKRPGVGRLPSLVPFALLLFVTFPGLYLAPFYGGIAGWTYYSDMTRPVPVYGHKFVNDVGEEIWFNHAFFQPITLAFRFDRVFLARDPNYDHFLKFMYDTYSRNYNVVVKGRLPHQWALGRFAYPTHSIAANNASDYIGKFAPERIVEVKQVTEYYSRSGEFLYSETGPSYKIQLDAVHGYGGTMPGAQSDIANAALVAPLP